MSVEISQEKHWNKDEREGAPADAWALPEKKKLRIDDAKHIKLAWDMVDRVKGLTDEEKSKARKRILRAAKKANINTKTWKQYTPSKEDYAETAGSLPPPSDNITHLMFHLAEEASQIAWAVSKAKRLSFNGTDPKTGAPGLEQLNMQIAEFHAALTILNEELADLGSPQIGPSPEQIAAALEARRQTLREEFEAGRFFFINASEPTEIAEVDAEEPEPTPPPAELPAAEPPPPPAAEPLPAAE